MTPQTRETLVFLTTIGTFALTAGGITWKVLEAKLKAEIQVMSSKLELRDKEIEHLHDRLNLSVNGLQEKFAHFNTRTRGEIEKNSDRLSDVEDFLVKTSDFTKRKSFAD